MPRYIIEREIPGAGRLSAQELNAISARSCSVLARLGPEIQWVHSYVSENKITCIYIAPNEELIRRHAEEGGFPADRIERISQVIDPQTAEPSAIEVSTGIAV